MNTEINIDQRDKPKRHTRLSGLKSGPAVFWAIALVSQLPLLGQYLTWIWRFEHYQYFPVLLLATGYLAWLRSDRPLRYPSSWLSFGLFGAAACILVIGSFLNSPWFASVSFLLLASSFLCNHQVGYLAVPLLLLVRLPLNFDVQLVTALQAITTRLSSYALDLMAVPHLVRGNVIELAKRELLVAEACSGVQSAFTIAFVALMIVAWFRRPLVLVPLYLAISLAWAVLANTLRVTTIAYVAARLEVDLSRGLTHDGLGYLTLAIAILLTLSTDALLALLFHPVDDNNGLANPFLSCWAWLFKNGNPTSMRSMGAAVDQKEMPFILHYFYRSQPLVIATLLLISLMSFVPIAAHAVTAPPARKLFYSDTLLVNPTPESLGDLGGEVRFAFVSSVRDGDDPRLGQNADQWDFVYERLKGRLVLSQVYSEWHELVFCYAKTDWKLHSADLISVGDDATSTKVRVAALTSDEGTHGYLIYSAINPSGDVISPPEFDFSARNGSLLDRAFSRCVNLVFKPKEAALAYDKCAMVQMWVVTSQELDGETLQVLAKSLAHARDRFAAAIRSPQLNGR